MKAKVGMLAAGCLLAASALSAQTMGAAPAGADPTLKFYGLSRQYYQETVPDRKVMLRNTLFNLVAREDFKRAAASDARLTFAFGWFAVEAGLPPTPAPTGRRVPLPGDIFEALLGTLLTMTLLPRLIIDS
jgi:hypothetical protein